MHFFVENMFNYLVLFSESPISNDNGIPHALEHLVFLRDNAKGPSIDEFATLRLCSAVNGFTYEDHTW